MGEKRVRWGAGEGEGAQNRVKDGVNHHTWNSKSSSCRNILKKMRIVMKLHVLPNRTRRRAWYVNCIKDIKKVKMFFFW